MNREELIAKISTIVSNYWKQHQEPLLLSQLPNTLEKGSYEDYVEQKGWKTFLESTEGENAGYKLVQHPTQLARVGLIPFCASFDFLVNDNKIEIETSLLYSILEKIDKKQLKTIKLPADITLALVRYRLTK